MWEIWKDCQIQWLKNQSTSGRSLITGDSGGKQNQKRVFFSLEKHILQIIFCLKYVFQGFFYAGKVSEIVDIKKFAGITLFPETDSTPERGSVQRSSTFIAFKCSATAPVTERFRSRAGFGTSKICNFSFKPSPSFLQELMRRSNYGNRIRIFSGNPVAEMQ